MSWRTCSREMLHRRSVEISQAGCGVARLIDPLPAAGHLEQAEAQNRVTARLTSSVVIPRTRAIQRESGLKFSSRVSSRMA